MLSNAELVQNVADEFDWTCEANEVFYVKFCFEVLISRSIVGLVTEEVRYALSFFWKVQAPSNILMFGWRLTLNRLPTRDQLMRRDIVVDDIYNNCAFSFKEEESKIHLFDMCEVSRRIWAKMCNWLGNNLTLSIEDLSSFILICQGKR